MLQPEKQEDCMNKKLITAGLALALSAGYASTVVAQAKPETMVKERQASMTLQWKYLGPMYRMAQGRVPYDANVIARNAGYLEVLSKMAWDGFDPSTRNQKTAALPAVYTDTAKFKEAQDRFQRAASQLVAASKGGNEATVKAAIGDVLNACNACHDSFREKQ